MIPLVERSLALSKVGLFAEIPAEELLGLARLSREVHLHPGDLLIHEGDHGDSLFVVVRGALVVQQGSEAIAHLGAGECVGELAVLDGEPRSANVAALEPTVLIEVHRHDLLDLLVDHPSVSRGLTAVLLRRIRGDAS